MPLIPPRPAWWRIPSPSILVLVLLFSFFPWIEIGCESKVDTSNPMGGLGGLGGLGQAKGIPSPNFASKTIVATQSGFQIATGGHSDANQLGNLQQGNAKGVTIGAPTVQVQPGSGKDGPSAAPLMFVFFLTVLAAIVAGFAMPPSPVRLLVVGACTGAAIVMLLIQSLILGFPAANDVAKSMQEAKAVQGMAGQDMVSLFVHYTTWYWLTWVLLFLALVPLVLEQVLAGKKQFAGFPHNESEHDDRLPPILPPS
jgi:hypothetical protein